ncbi:DNA polymerase III subunit gamma and tau [Streptosporangium sp. KLBMP 9127]|nr:DNA polymerase III subunit gamma and tau [Streptosporangium sp. KLBMP 9127]
MSLALYRKYRPGTFAEVKGQDHVTEPLRQALRSGRINHAYLFSGPRGCGKTSSARILARSLNCEQGPTPDPCGKCDSCVALAATGPGHLDVIEIDAASHGGVDDARDLRERAFFAPVSARFKIYIIDEAHMVTREGFNALLKLVEEPPPHLKFVFATTEPEKVIGTIKSRTHHYPFRLMPPAALRALLEEILLSESVPYEPAALPLVIRAGAGSARDSLSILDQLLAGADDAGITYAKAVSLLGYTDADLLDEVIDAFAARTGSAVFQAVNRVVEGGHDPRRFAMDLLERFRDLVILANVPEAAGSGLLDRPADELERLQAQAQSMGPAELTRAAEVFNAGLTEMRGATSPRLLLELMCARILLPAAEQGEAALLARLERLERSGPIAQAPAPREAAPSAPRESPASRESAVPREIAVPRAAAQAGRRETTPEPTPGEAGPPAGMPASAAPAEEGTASVRDAGADDWPAAARPGATPPAVSAEPVADAPQPVQTGSGPGGLQQAWPAVLGALKQRSIVVWANVNTNAQVVGVEGNIVTLGFAQVGAMKNFVGGGKDAVVAAALGDVLGGQWRVEAVVGSGGGPAPGSAGGAPVRPGGGGAPVRPSGGGAPERPGGGAGPGGGSARSSTGNGSQGDGAANSVNGGAAVRAGGAASSAVQQAPAVRASGAPAATDESWPDAPPPEDVGSPPPPSVGLVAARSAAQSAAQSQSRPKQNNGWPEAVPARQTRSKDSEEVDLENDADAGADAGGLTGMALIQRELGGQVIGEIDHT